MSEMQITQEMVNERKIQIERAISGLPLGLCLELLEIVKKEILSQTILYRTKEEVNDS